MDSIERRPSKLGDFIQNKRKKNIPADPAERIRLAIELSELCLKLKNSCSESSKK